ncbi:NPCBM/NEW2 domain-containing protein [Bacillus sp. 31A1R]|uniref:NPCBM/NEW2 domain-containing protein n=1 Tax=Robertmurraya mangrovi TaxID=3098077 RepID=A0ABU5IXS3_9BACI|nr:NPCBM/NEW2 domain-containing protein [Bacillus sp. 31A1R]MDZ5471907.1 NPCBM/NEW2 domain-containing protein [Bacillus sp. 31A1R]
MKKNLVFYFLATFLLLGTLLQIEPANVHAQSSELYLTSDLVTSEKDAYFDKWSSGSFEDTSGHYSPKGIGLEPYYSSIYRTFAQFHIEDYSYTTLETRVGLQNGWNTGDRGETEFIIYADDLRIYSKTFSNTTPPEDLKLQIPTGTKYITLYAVMSKGSQGNHGAIFGNARLTNTLPASSKKDILALDNIGTSSEKDAYGSGWNSSPFKMSDGKLVARGYGLSPYYSSTTKTYATFNIQDYNYSTFETRVSLDNKWVTGDRGKTEVVIYADNKKIYSKTFNNKTLAQNLKLSLPKGTKYLTLYALEEKGTQGNHSVIFDNPFLSNSLKAKSADDTVSLYNLGTAEGKDAYRGQWSSYVFQMSNGQLVPHAYGLKPYYSSTFETYAKFFVADYSSSYRSLETKISLDNKWRTGDRGKSVVYVLADNKVIYTTTFTNKTAAKNVVLSLPSNTKYLTFKASHSKGGYGHGVIIEDPKLTKRPAAPSVSKITAKTTKVFGKAKANSTVTVKNGSKTIAKAKVSSKGTYSVRIPKQKAGTKLKFYVTYKGSTSAAKQVTVAK